MVHDFLTSFGPVVTLAEAEYRQDGRATSDAAPQPRCRDPRPSCKYFNPRTCNNLAYQKPLSAIASAANAIPRHSRHRGGGEFDT